MLKENDGRYRYFDETPRTSILLQEETEEDFLALIEREVYEAEKRLQMYNLEDEEKQAPRSKTDEYFDSYTVHSRESLAEHNTLSEFANGDVTSKTRELTKPDTRVQNSQKQQELENSLEKDLKALASPEPWKRLLDSNPGTKKSANIKLHHKRVSLDDSVSPGESEQFYNKQLLTSKDSIPSNEANLQGQPFAKKRESLREYRCNGTGEHKYQGNFLRENVRCTEDNEVDFEELYSLAQLQLKKTQTRLAQTESTLSSLQVEYDILHSSFETASQENERLQAENSELRERISRLISTKDNIKSTNDNEDVYRWRTLFQKAVSKLAEERQCKVKAENEKKKALKELEIFEEDIMKRFIVLRNQAKARIKEMKAWTNQMEQIRELLDIVPPELRNTHHGTDEREKLSHRQDIGADIKPSQPASGCNLDATNARRLDTAESSEVERDTLKRAERELASEHEAEEKLLEQWRVDAQRLTENFQLFQRDNLLQSRGKLERPQKLKKRASLHR